VIFLIGYENIDLSINDIFVHLELFTPDGFSHG